MLHALQHTANVVALGGQVQRAVSRTGLASTTTTITISVCLHLTLQPRALRPQRHQVLAQLNGANVEGQVGRAHVAVKMTGLVSMAMNTTGSVYLHRVVCDIVLWLVQSDTNTTSASALSAQSTSKTSPVASTLSTATSPSATTVPVPNASSSVTSSATPRATSSATSPASSSPSSTASRTSSASSVPTGGRLQYGGVNIAGFEFGTYDTCGVHTNPPYVNPTNWVAQINHFVNDDKLNAFRLPVAWQYLINQYDGADIASNTINTGNFAQYDQLVSGCLNSGAALCLIDLHNYARFNGKIIGQDGPTAAQFANLWGQIATKYAGQSRVAFNLMNEPHDESCNSPNGGVIDIQKWAATLQLAVNAIRAAGATSQLIILSGKGWTHAATYLPSSSDGSGPALMGITDPAGGTSKLIFEVHEYLDSNNSGCNCDCVTNNIGTAYGRGGFSALADYLRSNGRFAMLTESGGLNNNNCATYLCQELSFLANNTDVFLGYTTWSAGGFDSNYELTQTPTQNGNTWTDTSLVTSCVVKCFQGQC